MFFHDWALFCCDVTGIKKRHNDEYNEKKAQSVSHIPRSIVALTELEMELVIMGLRSMKIDAHMASVRENAGDSRITWNGFHTSNV